MTQYLYLNQPVTAEEIEAAIEEIGVASLRDELVNHIAEIEIYKEGEKVIRPKKWFITLFDECERQYQIDLSLGVDEVAARKAFAIRVDKARDFLFEKKFRPAIMKKREAYLKKMHKKNLLWLFVMFIGMFVMLWLGLSFAYEQGWIIHPVVTPVE